MLVVRKKTEKNEEEKQKKNRVCVCSCLSSLVCVVGYFYVR